MESKQLEEILNRHVFVVFRPSSSVRKLVWISADVH